MAKMNKIEKFFVNSRLQYYLHRLFGLSRLLKKLPFISYENILEIGCGVGITTELLAQKFPRARLMATDFDEELINIAKQKRPLFNISFQLRGHKI